MFCPNCGSNVYDSTDFCLRCGKNLGKAKFTGPISESDFEISLEGDVEAIFVFPNSVKKFFLTVKNNSLNSIPDVKVKLSGPPQVELLTNLIIFQVIGAKSTERAPVTILPKESGIFTLSAKLYSDIGHALTFPIELRSEASKGI